MRLVWGEVISLAAENPGVQEAIVRTDDGREASALNYPALAGVVAPGDRVLLNTTAVDLGLGTGGKDFVVARAGSGVALDVSSGGHVMKLRYTPLQTDVLAVEAQESPHHAVMREARSLEGMPVVACGLHSQVPLVAAAVKSSAPSLRVAYCMTDGGALPIALSNLMRSSVSAGLVDETVTCGSAFGGGLEAVNLHSGLLAARHVARADVAIVAIGPGVAGTATPFGHGGVAQGEALNAAGVLGGVPIAAPRVSFADERPRHRAVSHHTLTALAAISLVRARVPVPSLPADLAEALEHALAAAGVWERHDRVACSAGSVPPPDLRGIEVRTMGRGLAEDPAFFAAAFAAGEAAAAAVN